MSNRNQFSTITAGQSTNGHIFVLGVGLEDALPYVVSTWKDKAWVSGAALPSIAPSMAAISYGMGNDGSSQPTPQVIGLGADDGLPYLLSFFWNERWQEGYSAPLPVAGGTRFQRLIPAVRAVADEPSVLEIVGLSVDGLPYLTTLQDANGGWSAGTATALNQLSGSTFGGITFLDVAVGTGFLGNGSPGLQIVGIGSDNNPYLIAWQNNAAGAPNRGQPLTGPSGVSFTRVFAERGWDPTVSQKPERTLMLFGLDASGVPHVAAWQDKTGSWHQGLSPTPLPSGVAYTSLSLGRGQSRGKPALFVIGLGTDGKPYFPLFQTAGDGVLQAGDALPMPDGPEGLTFLSLVAAPLPLDTTLPRLQVLGLGDDHVVYQIAYQGEDGAWKKGAALPGWQIDDAALAVQLGVFGNPKKDPKTVVASARVIGALAFSPQESLDYLYPNSAPGNVPSGESGDGDAWMPLYFAKTKTIASYADDEETLPTSSVDIASGWDNRPLVDLLLGGAANQSEDALRVLTTPTLAVARGFSFYFWAAKEDDRVYAAYVSQNGDWSPLIELFSERDEKGNGVKPLKVPRAQIPHASPVAYSLGDTSIVLATPTLDEKGRHQITFYRFVIDDITYTHENKQQDVFVNYGSERPLGKPGRTTWIVAKSKSIPHAALPRRPGSGDNRKIQYISACANVARAQQAYLVLAVEYERGVRADAIVTLNERGMPELDSSAPNRGIVLIRGTPPSVRGGQSLSRVPPNRVRSIYWEGDGDERIRVRYLADNAAEENGKIVFDDPSWEEEPCDPDIEVPRLVRPLSGTGFAQAVVLSEPYFGPGANADADPVDLTVYRNVYTVVLSAIDTDPDENGKTFFITRRFGTALQVPSVVVASTTPGPGGDPEATGTVVNGIVDGPIPLPNSNLDILTGGFLGTQVGKVTFGSVRGESDSIKLDRYLAAGVSTKSKLTITATASVTASTLFGLAKDIVTTTDSVSAIGNSSFLGGATSGWEKIQTQSTQSNYTAVAPLVMAPGTPPVAIVQPTRAAVLFGEDPTLRQIAFRFRDACGRLVSPDEFALVLGRGSTSRVAWGIPNLSVTPGDLASYAPERIDRAMWAAYQASTRKDAFDERDYAQYFKRVLLKNAVTLASGRKYLELAWSNGGTFSETSDVVAQAVDSSGFKLNWEAQVGGSFSLGVSDEFKLDLAAVAGSLKASVELSLETLATQQGTESKSKTDTKTESFGLSASLDGLRAGVGPNDVFAYTMRIYFLQPSDLWVREAMFLANVPGLNITSRPWKIMFSVDPATVIVGPSAPGRRPRS